MGIDIVPPKVHIPWKRETYRFIFLGIYIFTAWLNPSPGTPRYITKNIFQWSSHTGWPPIVWSSLAGLPNISSASFWECVRISLHCPLSKVSPCDLPTWYRWRATCCFRWKFEGPWPDFSLVQWPAVFEMVLWGVASYFWWTMNNRMSMTQFLVIISC